MDKVCAACGQAITAEQQWFRIREDYVHVSCYDKYLKLGSEEREREKAKAAPPNAERLIRR